MKSLSVYVISVSQWSKNLQPRCLMMCHSISSAQQLAVYMRQTYGYPAWVEDVFWPATMETVTRLNRFDARQSEGGAR